MDSTPNSHRQVDGIFGLGASDSPSCPPSRYNVDYLPFLIHKGLELYLTAPYFSERRVSKPSPESRRVAASEGVRRRAQQSSS